MCGKFYEVDMTPNPQKLVTQIRRNHALEHATLNILRMCKGLTLSGYSDFEGFWVVGEVTLEDLQQAADEALLRLKQGDARLAVHAYCGTNLVVSGMLAGTAAFLTMLRPPKGLMAKLERWSMVVSLVTLGLAVAQPLGPLLQERVTTDPNPGETKIVSINRHDRPRLVLHRIRTTV
jgi:Na+/H+ antiporter NhaB